MSDPKVVRTSLVRDQILVGDGQPRRGLPVSGSRFLERSSGVNVTTAFTFGDALDLRDERVDDLGRRELCARGSARQLPAPG